MKTAVIIPIKSKSTRVPGKNFKKINGKPLFEYTLDKVKKCNFDEIYVDTDSKLIKRYCNKKKINIIHRLKSLSKDSANGNDLLNYHLKLIDSDIYFQLFITAPLLKVSTINNCIKILKENKKYDSILTSKSIYSWFWFNKKPVNYRPDILPRSQDAKPIVQETTGLYGVRKRAFKKYKCRIGKKPFFYEVSEKEVIDLDTKNDIEHLKKLMKLNK